MNIKEKKCLIAYYSRRGENYFNGRIVELEVGNTETAAGIIQSIAGGDLFRIDTVKPYPKGYHETTEAAKIELKENARPELTDRVENISEYDLIFIGYPNWWGTMPMAVFTFLESHNLSGKTVIPFCTHEGSGMGRSDADLRKLAPGSKLLKGIALHGSTVSSSSGEIREWIERLHL